MSDKLKLILGIIGGILGTILLFCLIVCIACSVNGLTFGGQIVSWFTSKPSSPEVETVAQIISHNPIM